MISSKMTDALNEQINKEMASAYLYLSMSAHSMELGLSGFANWFMVQYKEEMSHAMKIYHYLQEQGSKVVLKTIQVTPSTFKSPMDMFKKTLAHEQFVTKSIHGLVDLAIAEKDHATQIFLQWFVTEQVEEEANDQEIIATLEMIGDHPGSLYMLNRELCSRTFKDETVEE